MNPTKYDKFYGLDYEDDFFSKEMRKNQEAQKMLNEQMKRYASYAGETCNTFFDAPPTVSEMIVALSKVSAKTPIRTDNGYVLSNPESYNVKLYSHEPHAGRTYDVGFSICEPEEDTTLDTSEKLIKALRDEVTGMTVQRLTSSQGRYVTEDYTVNGSTSVYINSMLTDDMEIEDNTTIKSITYEEGILVLNIG